MKWKAVSNNKSKLDRSISRVPQPFLLLSICTWLSLAPCADIEWLPAGQGDSDMRAPLFQTWSLKPLDQGKSYNNNSTHASPPIPRSSMLDQVLQVAFGRPAKSWRWLQAATSTVQKLYSWTFTTMQPVTLSQNKNCIHMHSWCNTLGDVFPVVEEIDWMSGSS